MSNASCRSDLNTVAVLKEALKHGWIPVQAPWVFLHSPEGFGVLLRCVWLDVYYVRISCSERSQCFARVDPWLLFAARRMIRQRMYLDSGTPPLIPSFSLPLIQPFVRTHLSSLPNFPSVTGPLWQIIVFLNAWLDPYCAGFIFPTRFSWQMNNIPDIEHIVVPSSRPILSKNFGIESRLLMDAAFMAEARQLEHNLTFQSSTPSCS